MKASDVITQLQQEMYLHGDLEVYICQECSEDSGENTMVEFVDTPEFIDGTPAFIRLGDFID